MADTQGNGASIFRQSAMSRIASADDLDKYLRITNPSAWAILLAAVLLVAGLLIWSTTAVIPTTVSVTGLMADGTVSCWVTKDVAEKIEAGEASALVLDEPASIIEVSNTPWSKAELTEYLDSDYLVDSVAVEDWNFPVTIAVPKGLETESTARPVPVSITVSQKHPINLIFAN